MLKTLKQSWQSNKVLWLIILVALLFRLPALAHGYPYIFNTDEPALVRSTMGLFHTSVIDHFDWPHFNYYFNFFFYFIFVKFRGLVQMLGLRSSLEPIIPMFWNDPFVFYFISRKLNALLSVLTLIPLFLLTKEIFSAKKVAAIATLFLAFTPYYVESAPWALQDVPVLFWGTWALYFSFMAARTFKLKYFVLVGVFIALSAGVKYNGVLLSLILPGFVLAEGIKKGELKKQIIKSIKPLIIAGAVALIAFLITNYRIILDWDVFWSYERSKGFLWQLNVNSSPLPWAEYLPNLYKNLRNLTVNFGYSIWGLYILGFAMAFNPKLKKHDQSYTYFLCLLIFSALFILYTSRFHRSPPHYFIPFYTMIVIVAAGSLNYLEVIFKKFKLKNIFLAIMVFLIMLSSIKLLILLRDDTREIALKKYYFDLNEQDIKVYFKGSDMSMTDTINNLGMKRYEEGDNIPEGTLLLSSMDLSYDVKIVLVDTIDNNLRNGPEIYVYKANTN